ncbi:MAG: 4-alpha-glucanotransferase [Alphaproteobacteria bacterium]|nr:4-alpha-glucanotransferase [Alphaproteobacteria bacterium]
MENKLYELADKLGVVRCFSDGGMAKKTYNISDDTLRFFCTQLGFDAKDDNNVEKSLKKFDDMKFKTALESIVIVRVNNPCFCANLTGLKDVSLSLKKDDISVDLDFEFELIGEEKTIGRHTYAKVLFKLKNVPEIGYYDLELKQGKNIYKSVMAVVPEKCYTTDEIESAKLWGYSLQLYALKSKRNWGVGDFTDLKNFALMCKKAGADVIGLNPLNVLFHDFPENASPYSSISRLFLNPIYIDVENVVGFDTKMKQKYQEQIDEAKQGELIDYTKVYSLKAKVLAELFEKISKHKKYVKEFEEFKQQKGWDLETLTTFQAIYSKKTKTVWGGWCAWEKDFQNPNSLKVAEFKKEHNKEIEFFMFMQFEADRQLKEVYQEIKDLGLKVGLYRDLPVGVCKDSAELWADRYVFVDKAGAGAPPDAFFPTGQKWCLGAFNPFELKNRAYEPYLKILRANMAYAGALRIDHVMGLMRLFMIPDNKDEGTYIHYNFDDMLGLLALESHLHQCSIVGESIGNVPEGFLDKLKEYNLYAISVIWAERWNEGNGDFKMSKDYPFDAFVSVGTHDMTPLKMWWFGYDIELMRSLNLSTDEDKFNAYKRRERDRFKLLDALDFNGVWPQDNLRKSNYLYGEGYPEGIVEAVHKLVAKAPSKVMMMQLEDIMGVDKLQNLPGTDREQYPNWRLRLPVDLEDLETLPEYERNVKAIKSVR